MTIRLTNDQHERLRTLAQHRGITMNKPFEEFGTRAIAEFDVELRFRALTTRGNVADGLTILDRLDAEDGAEPGQR